jgi:uncharacterized BrkB/YihY/UPF0761 family membrane protein
MCSLTILFYMVTSLGFSALYLTFPNKRNTNSYTLMH